MLMSQNNVSFRPILRNIQNHKEYGLCYKCLNYKELSDFAPISDVESRDHDPNEIDWFAKFKAYQPSCLNLLNTTDEELAKAWGITVVQLKHALSTDRLRINSSRNYMYINSHPWEEQSYCRDCISPRTRHPESESDPTNVYADYVQLLDGLRFPLIPYRAKLPR